MYDMDGINARCHADTLRVQARCEIVMMKPVVGIESPVAGLDRGHIYGHKNAIDNIDGRRIFPVRGYGERGAIQSWVTHGSAMRFFITHQVP